jgi:hypothetical protein
MQPDHRLGMSRYIGLHRMDHAKLIGMMGQLWKQLRHPKTALSMLLETPWTPHQPAARTRSRFSVIAIERWFVVERVDMRRTTAHAKKQNSLGGPSLRRMACW